MAQKSVPTEAPLKEADGLRREPGSEGRLEPICTPRPCLITTRHRGLLNTCIGPAIAT